MQWSKLMRSARNFNEHTICIILMKNRKFGSLELMSRSRYSDVSLQEPEFYQVCCGMWSPEFSCLWQIKRCSSSTLGLASTCVGWTDTCSCRSRNLSKKLKDISSDAQIVATTTDVRVGQSVWCRLRGRDFACASQISHTWKTSWFCCIGVVPFSDVLKLSQCVFSNSITLSAFLSYHLPLLPFM